MAQCGIRPMLFMPVLVVCAKIHLIFFASCQRSTDLLEWFGPQSTADCSLFRLRGFKRGVLIACLSCTLLQLPSNREGLLLSLVFAYFCWFGASVSQLFGHSRLALEEARKAVTMPHVWICKGARSCDHRPVDFSRFCGRPDAPHVVAAAVILAPLRLYFRVPCLPR